MRPYAVAASLLLVLCAGPCWGQGEESDTGSSPETSSPSPVADVSSTSVNSSLLLFQGNLADFGSHVFGQETACTASEELQFMTMTNMTVPVEEVQIFAIKTWQSPNSVGAQIQNVTYFDLETGRIVTGNTVYDWNRALTYFNYTILLPNVVDMPAYQHKMLQLNYTVSNLTTGETTASRSCQSAIPQLQGVSDYLNSILSTNLSDSASLDGGLRPTELQLPGGCISESSVNYEGTVLQSIRNNKTSQGDCCAACEALSGCNVWVWCPSYGGCSYGDNSVFPMYGCDLKHQDNYTDMSQLPLAYSRGPPTPFTSGRYVNGT